MSTRMCVGHLAVATTVVICAGLTPPTRGQCNQQELAKLTATDGAANDRFGVSVAMSGETAVVGANWDNDHAGSAYIFQKWGGGWTQTTRLSAADGAAGDSFGFAVAIYGETVVVGALGSGVGGSAYVFQKLGGVWTQTAKLSASDGAAGDFLGRSVAISGDTIVVGAATDDQGYEFGAAYVFQKLAGVWTQAARLSASDGAAHAQLGYSISISGDTLVVGVYRDDEHGLESGSAYVFQKLAGVWTQTAKLSPNDATAGDRFGWSVAISGDTALVGASYDGDHGFYSGSVYVYQTLGGVWTQSAKLSASDAQAGDRFGRFVAISGDMAVVGAPSDGDYGPDSGSAYVFKNLGGIWTQIAKLSASDATPNDYFGLSVAISGNTSIVAARYDDDHGTDSGSAYLFVAPYNPCDTNCDGSVNLFDIQPFVNALSPAPPPGCSPCAADTNADGSINLFDIDGFVACLGG